MSKSFSIANNKSIKDAIKAFNKLAVKSLAVVKKKMNCLGNKRWRYKKNDFKKCRFIIANKNLQSKS